jgi:hypothetical protein
MMRRLLWLTLVSSLALPACGGGTNTPGKAVGPPTSCAQIYALLRFTPAQAQQDESAGGCVHPDLAFSGELRGRAQVAHVDAPCAKPQRGASMPSSGYDLTLAGALYTLRLDPFTTFDRKPATLSEAGRTPALAELDQRSLGSSAASRTWLASSGTFAADATGTAGKLDLTLTRDISGASPVHLTGSWTCTGRPPATATPQPTGPCSSAYAAALSPENAASLRSDSCEPQDLTVSGAINGRISDAAVEKVDQGLLPGATDACGGDAHHFAARLVTGLGGEQLTLELRLGTDPATGPRLGAADYGPMSEDVVPSPTVVLHAGQINWGSRAGTLSLDASRTTGRLDMDLAGGVTGTQSVHITGLWRCA